MTVVMPPVRDLRSLLELEAVKPDAFLGSSPRNGWPRLYGGQVVAQALRAAALTVASEHRPHSLHAYFVRAGSEGAPVLYEVDRVRDGASFTTRQVVAYQAGGAILNLIASFHVAEGGPDVSGARPPSAVPDPETVARDPSELFYDHRPIRRGVEPEPFALSWMTIPEDLGDDPVLHACAFAYLSDEDALGVALARHPLGGRWDELMAASLDHAIWFHRPLRADAWLLCSLEGTGIADARGHAVARVFDRAGVHVATVAQEGLGRVRQAKAPN